MSTGTNGGKKQPVKRGAPAKTDGRKKGRKKPTNLSLDPEAVARGEQFGKLHGKSVSELVTGFLYSLPGDPGASDMVSEELAPSVRRLFGVAADRESDRDAYRAHLHEKYGSK